LCANNFV